MFRFLGVAALAVASVVTPQGAHGQTCDPSQPGCITEFAVPRDQAGNAGQPRGITRGPDGAIWFTEGPGPANGNKIARIPTSATPANPQIIEFLIPTPNSTPNSITTGPDGALWFTEFNGGKIGRIPTSATPADPQITEFPVSGAPSYITTGPDGALWFTEFGSNGIGRITTDGLITEFALPQGSSGPYGIAVGPDGALWFTEYYGAKIGRIPTTATPENPQITEFPISSGPSIVSGITAGPDGALWFLEQIDNKVGRIPTSATPANPQITEFLIPTANSSPYMITLGPDGALWFTEDNGNNIGRIPTSATPVNPQITEFPISANSAPFDITVGSDGELWFTDIEPGYAIGRLALASPPSGPTVTALLPTSGTTLGGTPLTITGTNFTGATAVTFGGTAATSPVVVNDTTITTVAPPHATAGAVDVVVSTPEGNGTGPGIYTYVAPPTVTSISPNTGPASGGTPVTIMGTNFTGAAVVKFGGAPATTPITVNSTTSITATSPASNQGVVHVTVTTAGGTSAVGSFDQFTYIAPAPAITSVTNPVTGSMQQSLFTINGQNFAPGVTVTLHNLTTSGPPQNLTPVYFSTTQLTVQFVFGCTASNWSVQVVNSDSLMSMPPVQFSVVTSAPVLAVTTPPSFPLTSLPNIQVPASKGMTSFTVANSGCGTLHYQAAVQPGSSWLKIAPGTGSGLNSGTVDLNFSANAGAERSGTIRVIGTDSAHKAVSGSPVTVTVEQLTSAESLLSGKGDWIHLIGDAIKHVNGPYVQDLIDYEQSIGVRYLIVKAGEGDTYYVGKDLSKLDANFVTAAHNAHPRIAVFGYHYVYGGAIDAAGSLGIPPSVSNCNNAPCTDTDPKKEALIAQKILDTGADGVIIDAEDEYFDGHPWRIQTNGKPPPLLAAAAAKQYIQTIRSNPKYRNAFLAYAPYPVPTDPPPARGLGGETEPYDAPFPYRTFGENTQAVLPQAYYRYNGKSPCTMVTEMNGAWISVQNSWVKNNHPNAVKPIFPIGWGAPPDSTHGGATPDDISTYVNQLNLAMPPASAGGYTGVSFWDAESHTPGIWAAISAATLGPGSAGHCTP